MVCEVFPCPRHPLTQGTINLLNLFPVCTPCLSMLYFKKKAMDFFSFHFGARVNSLISQQVFSKHPKYGIVIWSFVSRNSLELGLSGNDDGTGGMGFLPEREFGAPGSVKMKQKPSRYFSFGREEMLSALHTQRYTSPFTFPFTRYEEKATQNLKWKDPVSTASFTFYKMWTHGHSPLLPCSQCL